MGVTNRISQPNLFKKNIIIKENKTIARLTLIYGCEVWTHRETDKKRLTANEINIFLRSVHYTKTDYKRNANIYQEPNAAQLLNNLESYRHNWTNHIHRLNKNLKIKIYKTIILSVVLYDCEKWSLTLVEESGLRVFKTDSLYEYLGP